MKENKHLFYNEKKRSVLGNDLIAVSKERLQRKYFFVLHTLWQRVFAEHFVTKAQ